MSNKLEIITLVDNHVTHPQASARGLLAEHGLSFWINYCDRSYLFDVGRGITIQHNADILNLDLNRAKNVILSHAHRDHTGGLESVLKCTGGKEVIVHPQIFNEKYVKKEDGKLRENGIAHQSKYYEKMGAQLKLKEEDIELDHGLYLMGPITSFPYPFDDTDMPNRFIKDENGSYYLDEFKDEQYLCIKTKEGLVLIVGCTHLGLKNTVVDAVKKIGDDRVNCIIGGLHLFNVNKASLGEISNWLKHLGLKKLICSHCTGFNAASFFDANLEATVFENYVGATIQF